LNSVLNTKFHFRQALLEVTEETHPDYSHLVSALEQIQKIADEINQSVEVSESTKAVHELSKQIPNIHVRFISKICGT
jgi:hypothetical protein